MKTIAFTKVESIGNHFVLVDAMRMGAVDWSRLAIQTCAQHFGVGADGLLAILPSNDATFRMRMFNPDGTEDACGNGLRCAAVFYATRFDPRVSHMSIEAIDGSHAAEIRGQPQGLQARINMGRPSFRAVDIPVLLEVDRAISYPLPVGSSEVNMTCVRVGTPHAVIHAPAEAFWDTMPPVSAEIETHPTFPERISVTWCAVEAHDRLRVRTWERAVGPTLGCGTGACCALAASEALGLASGSAVVTSPGGSLAVEEHPGGDIYLTGSANIVFDGEFSFAGM